jgi:hypothetical protein
MKKLGLMMALIGLTVGFFSSCSDGMPLVTFSDGKKSQTIKIADVKKEIFSYVVFQPGITNDPGFQWHKDYIFNQNISANLISADQLNSGLMNKPDFQTNYDTQYQKQYLVYLYQNGQTTLKKEALKSKFDIIKVSHILLMTPKSTNENGKERQYSEAEFQKLVMDKENKAMNIIDSLKTSKNIESDFSNIAVAQSEDRGSAAAGGDIGYFTLGMMVKEFEDAAFAAKSKGLIDKPVKTTYGVHIIYVTYPKQNKSIDQIKGLVGNDKFRNIGYYLQGAYNKMLMDQSLKKLYTIDTTNKVVVVGGKSFNVNQIPDDAVMLTIYKKNYTWKDAKNVFNIMIPVFIQTLDKAKITDFQEQMGNLENFIPAVETAKNSGIENTDKFKKDMEKTKDTITKQIASQTFDKEMWDKAKAEITPADLRKYYDANKAKYTKDVKGAKVQMSYGESQERVKNDSQSEKVRSLYQAWAEDAKKKYKVSYNEGSLKTLISMEVSHIRKAQSDMEKERRKSAANNKQPQGQK